MATIPASAIVNVVPSVLSAGGSALALNGLMLSSTINRIPFGSVLSFATAQAVANYFGATSNEALLAAIYFGGFTNATVSPGALLAAYYNTAASSAFLRGGSLAALTLTQLQAISGTLSVTIDGVVKSGSVNLSGASSFANAATIIATGLGLSGGQACTFDTVTSAFLITSGTTGATSTIGFGSGTNIAAPLALTSATGAVTSQGALQAVPATFMNALVSKTQNWATFFTAFDPDVSGNANKLLFAQWNQTQASGTRYAYIAWDTDSTPSTTVPASASLGALVAAQAISGTCLVWQPAAGPNPTTGSIAAFVSGAVAATNTNQTNGRATYAFKAQGGLAAEVTDSVTAANLAANGYNFYGAYGTANAGFTFFNNGSISGSFLWLDSFVDQIWMNAAFQQALMTLLTTVTSIPYNVDGQGLIEAALATPIQNALNFGAIRSGVVLSSSQIASVNNAAGVKIDTTLQQRGYYLQVLPASPSTRQARQSPPCNFWYTDGQAVQQITLASIELQ